MKINPVEFDILALVSTILKFILAFGVPFCIVGIGTILGLWEFSWGGVLAIYIFMRCYDEVKMTMAIMGLEKDGDDTDGS